MPTYEPKPLHLKEAVESVLAQTEKNWVLFIHDDSSTEDVADILKPYLSDPRITFKRGEKNLGIGGNWNHCLSNANGTYIQYLFQDDVWKPEYLAKAVAALESTPKAGFASVGHTYAFEGPSDTKPLYDALLDLKKHELTPGWHDGREMLQWWMDRGIHPNVIGEPSFVMMRATTVMAAGTFLEDMPQFLDVEYWTRLLRISDWMNVTEDHGSFRVHPSAASARNQEAGVGLFDRLRTMEMVLKASEGTQRSLAKKAVAQQLGLMIGKYMKRKQSGKAIAESGGGAAKKFILKHPLLTLRGYFSYLTNSQKSH